MKKILSLILAIVLLLTANVCAFASADEVVGFHSEKVLTLDENGRAEVVIGYAIFEDQVMTFDLENQEQSQAFYAIEPRATGTMHVGIEMTGTADTYRMYYKVTGVGLLSVDGYMQCKSTAWFGATVYHNQKFYKTSAGGTSISGNSTTFTLPAGTSQVKVGWHDVTIKDNDGSVDIDDKYQTVKVG